ncbi:acyltransferase family protein [Aerosakkonemataceae cyanobacterium BLCC-F154]|uniref:Acyltransferase family protein n=1 Tax=Floridaenema fluviatile BLCC-F154 TaxID=3153640 RepID=A0ABV4YGX6_9CYAN
MGFLRFILAVSVIIAHASPIAGLRFVGGSIAVETFFMISGFYMALILTEKYVGKGRYQAFLQSRLLRLFPAYWVVAIFIVLISVLHSTFLEGGLVLQSWMQNWNVLNIFSKIFLIFTNIFIVGQDWGTFLQVHQPDGYLTLALDYTKTEPQVHTFLLIPPAWSLSVELLFYMIAPLLVSRNLLTIVLMMFASLILRLGLYSVGLDHDPWTYRFFPTELLFFLGGIISYRIYAKFKNHILDPGKLLLIMLFAQAFTLGYQFIPETVFKQWIYYAVLLVSLPFVFIYTKKSKFDRLLGELSYPIYIVHLFVVVLIGRIVYSTALKTVVQNRQELILENFSGIITLFVSTLLAILLIKLVMEPVEGYRQSIAKKLTQTKPASEL